ncbi:hypothetical protein ACR3I8_20640 [Priestia flexa]|uniref:hypothetical protein n=1 Tax=Priestia flexa TaxID=86664 RepID=UPI001B33EA33|nr:hypothetical protein [Priestia flexa]MDT2048576.1 hypothetical protein [Priestia flexa]USY55373.1 hypothetical protein NIZ91_01355 [Bacillus sp. 1780r2a1]
MRNIIAFLFKTCLLLFLAGGTCLVFGQLAGILFQKGYLIQKSWDIFATPTFMISALAGILGFILGYLPNEKLNEGHAYSSDEFDEKLEHVR